MVRRRDIRAGRAAGTGLLLLALLGGATACARPEPAEPQPVDVLREYLTALERGDADAAWDLLDPALRGERTPDSFRAYVEHNRDELVEQARAALAAATEKPAEMRAIVRIGADEVTVLREPDGWRLAAPYWPAPRADTPADALRALHEALDRGDLATVRETLLRPPARDALDGLVAALSAAAAAAAESGETAGDEITVPFEGGGGVVLVREEGRWFVAALHFAPAPPDAAPPDPPPPGRPPSPLP